MALAGVCMPAPFLLSDLRNMEVYKTNQLTPNSTFSKGFPKNVDQLIGCKSIKKVELRDKIHVPKLDVAIAPELKNTALVLKYFF